MDLYYFNEKGLFFDDYSTWNKGVFFFIEIQLVYDAIFSFAFRTCQNQLQKL